MHGAVTLLPGPHAFDPASILALDAALDRVRAVFGETLVEADGERDQAAAIVRVAAEALAGRRPQAVAATAGPGSFTGIRAGLALARGLALGFGVPAVAVSTAEALAAEVAEGRVLAAIDSRRGHLFLAAFSVYRGMPEELLSPFAWRPGEALPAGDWHVVGEAAGRVDPAAAPTTLAARTVARLAAARLAGAIAPRPFAPIYVDPPSVRLPVVLPPAIVAGVC